MRVGAPGKRAGIALVNLADNSMRMLAQFGDADMLLAYGAQDVAVPGKHGRLLFDAIKPHNPGAEFHWYDEGGQNWSLESNRVDLWTRIEQFLGRHIGLR